jgi:cystathionine beta-lyase/cystathionine gamma-synthase
MKKKEVNSARTPVYRDAGFELHDASITSSAFDAEKIPEREPEWYIYSRYRNPTVVSAEEEIMKLEKCDWALLTQSGMSAIDLALSIFQRGRETKPWLFFTEIYGGTVSFIESVLVARRGLDIHYFMPEGSRYNLRAFEQNIAALRPELVYVETLSNPMLIVSDIKEIAGIAKKYGCRVIVDNTFATPYLFRPLDAGADLVVHSVTKYFSGHGNLSAGVICGNDRQFMKEAIEYRKFAGHMISPDDAYRLETQIQTFTLRFARQCENASRLSGFLAGSGKVEKVWYPGLENHDTHDLTKSMFSGKGYGAMVTFDLKGAGRDDKRKKRDDFIRTVSEKIKLIPTLGDSKTILMPVESVWGTKFPEPGMIRMSLGFEDYSEIETVVTRALDSL